MNSLNNGVYNKNANKALRERASETYFCIFFEKWQAICVPDFLETDFDEF